MKITFALIVAELKTVAGRGVAHIGPCIGEPRLGLAIAQDGSGLRYLTIIGCERALLLSDPPKPSPVAALFFQNDEGLSEGTLVVGTEA